MQYPCATPKLHVISHHLRLHWQAGFPAREGGDDTEEATAESGVLAGTEGPLILEHQCSEASDCSDKGQSKLLVGTHLTDVQTPRLDSYEDQVHVC